MKFCDTCGNALFPRKGRLYCKVCDEEFDLGSNQEDYVIVRKIKHDERETAPIVLREGIRGEKISDQDRRAFEEYFAIL